MFLKKQDLTNLSDCKNINPGLRERTFGERDLGVDVESNMSLLRRDFYIKEFDVK